MPAIRKNRQLLNNAVLTVRAISRIERLESRVLLSGVTNAWNSAVSGDWDNAGNWSLGHVPTSAEDVVITAAGTYTVTLDSSSHEVNSLALGAASGTQTLIDISQTLTIDSASSIGANGVAKFTGATVAGAGVLTNAGILSFNSLTFNAALNNQGTVLVSAGSSGTINGALTTAPGSQIQILEGQSLGGASLIVNGGFTNHGTITLGSAGGSDGWTDTLTVNNGTLTNAADGTITAASGGGYRTFNGSIINAGHFSVQASTTVNNGGFTFTNSGSISVATAQTLLVNYGTFNMAGGTMTGGVIDLYDLSVNVQSDAAITGVTLQMPSDTIYGPGTLTNAAGNLLRLTSTTINANLINKGILLVPAGASGTINGALTTSPGSQIQLLEGQSQGGSSLIVNSGFTNHGIITLGSAGGTDVWTDTLTVNNGTLTNAADGTIIADSGGGYRTFNGSISNAGSFGVQVATTVNNSGFTFTNSGSISVAAGQTLLVNYGTFNLAGGTMTGGTIDLYNLTANLQSDATITGVTLEIASDTIDGPGTFTNAAGNTLVLSSTTIDANLINQGILLVPAGSSGNINGALITTAASQIQILEGLGQGGSRLTISSDFTNHGTITLGSAGGSDGWTDTLSLGGTLTNAADGTITAGSGGGARTFNGSIANAGAFNVQADTSVNNSGYSFTNSGSVSVAPAQTLTVYYGTFNLAGGTMTGGVIDLYNLTANVQSDATITGVTLQIPSDTINGPGTLTNAAGNTLNLNSTTINANLINQGTVLVSAGASGNINGPLTAAPGSQIQILEGQGNGNSRLTVANGFTNHGTIVLGSAGGYDPYTSVLTISNGVLTNAADGAISAAAIDGSSTFNGSITNTGTFSVLGPSTINNSGYTFTNSGSISVAAGQTLAVNYGTFNFAGGSMSGSVVALYDLIANVQIDATITGVTLQIPSDTIYGPGTLTNAAGNTLVLSNSTIDANFINQGTVIVPAGGTGAINGALTASPGSQIQILEGQGYGNTRLTVANGFTNDGAIILGSAGGYDPYTSVLTISNGVLTNAADGTMTGAAGNGERDFNGSVINAGTLSVQAATDVNNSGDAFTNNGSISVAAGQTLTVNYGTFNMAGGAMTGGTVALDNLIVNVQSDTTVAGVTLLIPSDTINGPATLTNGIGNSLTFSNTTINANLINKGILVLPAGSTGTINGALTASPGSQIQILEGQGDGNTRLTVANGFTNDGTIAMGAAGGYDPYAAILTINSGALTNAADGTISMTSYDGSRTVNAPVNNFGLFSVIAYTTISGDLANTGKLVVDPAETLSIQGNFSQPALGQLSVAITTSSVFSHLLISAQAALGGTLNVSETGGLFQASAIFTSS